MLHLLKMAQTGVRTREDVFTDFKNLVNMSLLELEKWLATNKAQNPAGEMNSPELIVDKKISQKLVKILRKKKIMLTKGEYACMDEISSHINQLYRIKPANHLFLAHWRCALMNLGHDPLKVSEN